ncbi:MAG: SDR family oxidoreductase [Dehalococcoidia bacterium]|nr:SDR family oxidoreductase [Dehalococcoidia bacterium]
MAELDGKIAIVTGAGSPVGMGRTMTLALVKAGAKVGMMDIDGANLAKTADQARAIGGANCVRPLVGDVSNPADCERVVKSTIDGFGGLHILVNNAGTNPRNVGLATRSDGPAWETPADAFARVVAINFSGPFYMARAAVPHLVAQKWGRLIGVTTSLDTMYRKWSSPYGPSKAGHEAWMATVAQELEGTGVTANVLVPGGPANTNLLPPDTTFDRALLIQPEIMMVPIVWLVSDAADGVNGRRFIAYRWDASLPAAQRLEKAGAPLAWQQLGSQAVYGGAPRR